MRRIAKRTSLTASLPRTRFLMIPDEDRRHEMILFYLENASTTGHKISIFYDAQDNPAPHWNAISRDLTARWRESFHILNE